ncbi:Beta-Casp domain-containing protein [Aphelenchoides besseyi]|nr:Beta-Casp domain-containing protein [Aphelenchoides besseyi]KAI6212054.1 Beta-Casp domain-containing protein [Aphelenchoides besseyi]
MKMVTKGELTRLSSLPNQPCYLLRFPKATILLDCALNLDPLLSFMPCFLTNRSRILNSARLCPDSTKRMGGVNFYDRIPEVESVKFGDVQPKSIDAILISHWKSLIGLPFITERNEFHGVVYATIPTKELGGLVMKELIDYFGRIRGRPFSAEDRKNETWKNFQNGSLSNPTNWQSMFTAAEVESCLSRILFISLGETKVVNGATKVTAYSSGYAIGSCNWIIEYENAKFGYVSSSSVKTSHQRNSYWKNFHALDSMIITSLSRFPDVDPSIPCRKICSTLIETLKKGGNVLFPVNPVGPIYDLVEIIFGAMDAGKVSVDVPVYVISPAIRGSFSYVNIFTEWLTEAKASRVYGAEEPFYFTGWMEENRIKVYDNVYGQFSRDFRTPCVVLTGHPSMRFGSVVHFMELWGANEKNAVIVTDPDFPLSEVYKPFRNQLIRAYDYPIETRLDSSYVNSTLLPDLSPKLLIVPEEYAKPENTHYINYSSTVMIKDENKVSVINNPSRKRALVDADLILNLQLDAKKPRMISMFNLRGFLSTYDNKYEIVSKVDPSDTIKEPGKTLQNYIGPLSPEKLIEALRKNGFHAEHGAVSAGQHSTVRIPTLQTEIRIAAGGHSSRICCPSVETRRQIQEILCTCLEKLS